MHDPVAQQFALACGVAGAYVDVSDDVITSSITRQWGRGSEFDDARPGVFSFALSNEDGKYTPGNTASSLVTPLVEGMGVSWLLDGSLRSGSVRSAEPQFLADVSGGSSRVTVVVDDALGNAGRLRLGSLAADMVETAGRYLWWPLDDAAGSLLAAEVGGQVALMEFGGGVVMGEGGVPGGIGTQAKIVVSTSQAKLATGIRDVRFDPIPYASTLDLGWWGGWITVGSSGVTKATLGAVYADMPSGGGAGFALGVELVSGVPTAKMISGLGSATGPSLSVGDPHYFAAHLYVEQVGPVALVNAEAFIDGVSFATDGVGILSGSDPLTNAEATPTRVTLTVEGSTDDFAHFSNLSLTANGPLPQQALGDATAAERLSGVAFAVPEITLDTLPDLSDAVLATADLEGSSALDALNDVIRTEQGHIYTTTSGTLTAPEPKVKVRDRDRPETVSQTFDMTEIQYAPDFVRDISNMVSIATAIGPENSATWSDAELTQYVETASARDNVLLRDQVDLLAWAQDRIIRGKNVSVRIATFTIDALNTPTNRWADLTGLIPGDRIQITGLPSTQLGFSTLDGWLLGGAEAHSYPEQMLFTFHLQPVLPPTGIYDDDDRRYMAGGVLSLSADIDSSVTSMSIATSDPATVFTTSGGDLPLVVTVGDEQIEITACTGATPQVATIVRGVNGTTAAAHTAGDLIELLTETLYAF